MCFQILVYSTGTNVANYVAWLPPVCMSFNALICSCFYTWTLE